jgi:hypothetical protein
MRAITRYPVMQMDATTETGFNKIMAANRGEIAIRINRAGTELGLKTVRGRWPVPQPTGRQPAGRRSLRIGPHPRSRTRRRPTATLLPLPPPLPLV